MENYGMPKPVLASLARAVQTVKTILKLCFVFRSTVRMTVGC